MNTDVRMRMGRLIHTPLQSTGALRIASASYLTTRTYAAEVQVALLE